MNRTREDFCRELLDDHPRNALDPETLAARFVRYFDVPARPTMAQLKALLKRTGFGEVSGTRHMDAKGIHYSSPGGGYDIHYREDLWDGTQDYSVIHETYEIIYETLCDMDSGSPPDRKVCTQAERFAAAVLMQPRDFESLALEWGLDVLRLQRAFRCSYASVSIRLAEVLRQPPLMVVLYARDDGRDTKKRDQIARSPGQGRPANAGIRYPKRLPHLRGAGRHSPLGQAHTPRLPGRASRTLRHRALRAGRRLCRLGPARHQARRSGEGGSRRRARRLLFRPRTPDGRLGHAGA